MLFLLQDPASFGAADSAQVVQQPDSLLESVTQSIEGTVAMAVLVVLLAVAIFIYIERLLTINRANTDSEDFMKDVRRLVLSGDIQGALKLCESKNDPFARMIHKGISRLKAGASLKDIEGSIDNVGNLEIYRLERRLSVLATISGAAPMIGFLGTVLGMIAAFAAIVQTGGSASGVELAGGISTAMYTTAGGLIVGILAYLAYNSLTSSVNRVVYKLEITTNDFIDLLQEPAG
ncbi:MAG: MotA/TolQ/ExbB proton channel family protein [Bacteroidota bacterium]